MLKRFSGKIGENKLKKYHDYYLRNDYNFFVAPPGQENDNLMQD